jgi:hypothetical protein
MADLGSDLYGIDDITPDLGEVSGRLGLLQALATRLIQPRGGVHYDENNGFDTRSLLSSEVKPRGVEQSITAQLLADERVESASVTVTVNSETRQVEIRCDIVDADGPFRLVLDPANASAALLEEQL